MSGKYALIVGNTEYTDSGLAQLSAPGKDAEDFAGVLQRFCGFDDVKVFLNQPEPVLREAIDIFFEEKKPDDLLVLYFSGHGVRDELGALYLAVRNTNRFRLRSTTVKSDFIREAMDQSRSKRQVLILDCCNSGAFAQGTKAATGVSIGTASAFDAGYGRIILTASDATQFAWEGNQVIGETQNSLFTHYLIEGLKGQADSDGDGRITVDELYDYAYEQVRVATPKQTPSKFATKQQGEIVLRDKVEFRDIKALVQQNINVRRKAALIKEEPNPSKPAPVGSALARIKDSIYSAKARPSSQRNTEQETPLSKRILLFFFWLLIVLFALPFFGSFVKWQIQNIVLLFWVSMIIFGAIGTLRGWRRESIVFLAAVLGLALNHLLRRYVPAVYSMSEHDTSLFWLRITTLEIFLYLGYQFGRRISPYSSKAIIYNPFQEQLLGATLGAFNGYLFAGTALFYYFVADYPFPLVIVKTADPMLMQRISGLMLYMPPQMLGEPGIYFAVIVAVIFVLIVIN